MVKKTLVIGASLKTDRYSNIAIKKLVKHDYNVEAIGNKNGKVDNVVITNKLINFDDIHTVTLYLNKSKQQEYYEYIISLNPKRVIFNPGTENEEFRKILNNNSIKHLNACTLVLLSTISINPQKVINPLIGSNSYPIL